MCPSGIGDGSLHHVQPSARCRRAVSLCAFCTRAVGVTAFNGTCHVRIVQGWDAVCVEIVKTLLTTQSRMQEHLISFGSNGL